MRSFWRTLGRLPRPGTGPGRRLSGTGLDRALLRDIGLVVLADGVVGASFGAIAVSAGQPAWVPLAMSPTVFAGGAQFAALYIVLGGGGLAAAPFLPGGLPVLLALLGLVVLGRRAGSRA